MNIAREIIAAGTDLRYAELVRTADFSVPSSFLRVVNNAIGDLVGGARDLDFLRAKQAAELLIEALGDNPESAERMGFDAKAVELIKKAPGIFWRAQYRIEDADDHLAKIEKAVRKLGVGRR